MMQQTSFEDFFSSGQNIFLRLEKVDCTRTNRCQHLLSGDETSFVLCRRRCLLWKGMPRNAWCQNCQISTRMWKVLKMVWNTPKIKKKKKKKKKFKTEKELGWTSIFGQKDIKNKRPLKITAEKSCLGGVHKHTDWQPRQQGVTNRRKEHTNVTVVWILFSFVWKFTPKVALESLKWISPLILTLFLTRILLCLVPKSCDQGFGTKQSKVITFKEPTICTELTRTHWLEPKVVLGCFSFYSDLAWSTTLDSFSKATLTI